MYGLEDENGVKRVIHTNNGALCNPRNTYFNRMEHNGENGKDYKLEQDDKQTLFN